MNSVGEVPGQPFKIVYVKGFYEGSSIFFEERIRILSKIREVTCVCLLRVVDYAHHLSQDSIYNHIELISIVRVTKERGGFRREIHL